MQEDFLKTLCLADGHTFNDWHYLQEYVDSPGYFHRTCELCGDYEIIHEKDNEERYDRIKLAYQKRKKSL